MDCYLDIIFYHQGVSEILLLLHFKIKKTITISIYHGSYTSNISQYIGMKDPI